MSSSTLLGTRGCAYSARAGGPTGRFDGFGIGYSSAGMNVAERNAPACRPQTATSTSFSLFEAIRPNQTVPSARLERIKLG